MTYRQKGTSLSNKLPLTSVNLYAVKNKEVEKRPLFIICPCVLFLRLPLGCNGLHGLLDLFGIADIVALYGRKIVIQLIDKR